MSTKKKPKIYVLHHANCYDGTGAKYAAWKRFGMDAEYFPVKYGDPPPKMDPGSVVYILDFSYPRAILEELVKIHQSVVVLDHHKTAEEDLRGFPNAHFDMNKSGAVLAWEYFHKSPVPDLLLHVQDRDLWKFLLADTKNVTEGLSLLKSSMKSWDNCCRSHVAFKQLVQSGKALSDKTTLTVSNAVPKYVRMIKWNGHNVGVMNSTQLHSEIGNAVCLDKTLNADYAMTYSINQMNEVTYSLRSVGDFDEA